MECHDGSLKKVAVVGIGLIGSSILRAIGEKFSSIISVAIDGDPGVCERVRALGLADIVSDKLEDVGDSDLILICVPSHAVAQVVIALSTCVSSQAVVTDTASVKESILNAVSGKIPDDFPYVPGHPMAGGERSGPDSGSATLFDGRPCLLTPNALTPERAIGVVDRFWTSLGACVQLVNPKAHDQLVALSSHLPHLIAFALMEVLDQEFSSISEPMSFIGGGLREQIRLGMSNAAVWSDIFYLNSGPLLDRLALLENVLGDWRTAISQGASESIGARVTSARDSARKYSGSYSG